MRSMWTVLVVVGIAALVAAIVFARTKKRNTVKENGSSQTDSQVKEALSAFAADATGPLDAKKLFPLIVPKGYLAPPPGVQGGPPVRLPLLDDLEVVLVIVRPAGEVPALASGVMQYVRETDLATIKLSVLEAFKIAIDNLATAAEKGELQPHAAMGDDGKPKFVIWSGPLAASCALLPGLHAMVSRALATDSVVVAMPHREALLLFPDTASNTPDRISQFVKENEGDGRKPITDKLFRLMPGVKRPFFEETPIRRY